MHGTFQCQHRYIKSIGLWCEFEIWMNIDFTHAKCVCWQWFDGRINNIVAECNVHLTGRRACNAMTGRYNVSPRDQRSAASGKQRPVVYPKNHSKRKIGERRVSYDGWWWWWSRRYCVHQRNAQQQLEKLFAYGESIDWMTYEQLTILVVHILIRFSIISLIYLFERSVLIVSCLKYIYFFLILCVFLYESAVKEFCFRIGIQFKMV